MTDLSNVDKAAHEVLVAECRDGVLGLLPRSIFHNTVCGKSGQRTVATRKRLGAREGAFHLPASLQVPADAASQSVNPTIPTERRKAGEGRPNGNQPELRVKAHLRHSVGK